MIKELVDAIKDKLTSSVIAQAVKYYPAKPTSYFPVNDTELLVRWVDAAFDDAGSVQIATQTADLIIEVTIVVRHLTDCVEGYNYVEMVNNALQGFDPKTSGCGRLKTVRMEFDYVIEDVWFYTATFKSRITKSQKS